MTPPAVSEILRALSRPTLPARIAAINEATASPDEIADALKALLNNPARTRGGNRMKMRALELVIHCRMSPPTNYAP